MPNFKASTSEEKALLEEYHKDGGHPCAPYVDAWLTENKKNADEYWNALNKMKKMRSSQNQEGSAKNDGNEKIIKITKKGATTTKRPEKTGYGISNESIKLEVPKNLAVAAGIIVLVLAAIVLFQNNSPGKAAALDCSDGTSDGACSINKPGFCTNGTLIDRASVCGCPLDYNKQGDACRKVQKCADGTIYGECSSSKPLYCSDGNLVEKATSCGCMADETARGDSCYSPLRDGPKSATFQYVLRGVSDNITITAYSGLEKYLTELPKSYYCNPDCPPIRDLELKYVGQEKQKQYMKDLVDKIKADAPGNGDRARIAVSLVQRLPYYDTCVIVNGLDNKYPYDAIYNSKAVCKEKPRLLAFLLKELGYGVVYFNYPAQNYMFVGIKCPEKYSFQNSGYCFIETLKPAIITNTQGNKLGSSAISAAPEIITISDGSSLDSVSEEYNDTQEWLRISAISNASGGFLDKNNYDEWQGLVEKYGLSLS